MKKICVLVIIVLFVSSCVPTIIGQWTSNPNENTALTTMTGEQALPKIAVDGNGYIYVSWFSNEAGNYNVRLQRLDPQGIALWPEHGILVSSEPQASWITDYDLDVDPFGYAVITFTDIRSGETNPVAYRVSPQGDMMWGQTGIMLANNNNFDPSPNVCVSSVGNSIFAWQSMPDSGNSQIVLQKISPDGQLLWGDGIILSEAGIDYTTPTLLQAEGDFVYLVWHKETGPFNAPDRGLYVQKLDSDGNFLWTTDVEIYAPVPSGPVAYIEMCRDDSGGIIFTWYLGSGLDHFHSYIQRMKDDGTVSMPTNGVLVSTSLDRNHMYPVPAFLNQTQEIIVFFSEQSLNQIMRGFYAQKFDLEGNRLWGDEGIQLIGLSYNDYGLFMADGIGDKAICIYQAAEFGDSLDSKMQAVMLDSAGDFVWADQFIDLSTYQSQKLHNVMSTCFMGQWVAVWQDRRNDMGDIYAQNIQLDGTLGVVVNETDLDVNQPIFDRGFRMMPGWDAAQEFVPSYPVLSRVELYMTTWNDPVHPIPVEIRKDDPEGDVLFSSVIYPADVTTSFPDWGWVSVDIGVAVDVGETYVIVLRDSADDDFNHLMWGVYTSFGIPGPYPDGNMIFRKLGFPTWMPIWDFDCTFKTYG